MEKDLFLEKLTVGEVDTNCYILGTPGDGCLIIDPGANANLILKTIRAEGLILERIILTHGHGDHIGAVNEIKKETDVKISAGKLEKGLLENPDLNLSKTVGSALTIIPDEELKEGDVIKVANLNLKVIETPGHTMGSVSFYLEDKDILFCGDTIFKGTVGRTDLPGGSNIKLRDSIKKISALPEDVILYPGHGPKTSIKYETQYNPYFSFTVED